MVHEKYIRRGDKVFGPYLYETKRVDGRVVTNYVGKPEVDSSLKKLILIYGIVVGIIGLMLLFSILTILYKAGTQTDFGLSEEEIHVGLSPIGELQARIDALPEEIDLSSADVDGVVADIVEKKSALVVNQNRIIQLELKLPQPKVVDKIKLPEKAENIVVSTQKVGVAVNVDDVGEGKEEEVLPEDVALSPGVGIPGEIDVSKGTENAVDANVGQEVSGVVVEYVLPGPVLSVKESSVDKIDVEVSGEDGLTDIFAYVDVSGLNAVSENEIRVRWNEENRNVVFETIFNELTGKIETVMWNVEHLSNQTFTIIKITKAQHLDSNREIVSDIFEEVRELDGIWSETIPSDDFVRVTFEIPLGASNDITIWPRTVSGTPQIEIYEVDSSTIIAEFESIVNNQYNKVFLSGLVGEQDTFDLRIINGDVEFDHIVDPGTVEVCDGSATFGGCANFVPVVDQEIVDEDPGITVDFDVACLPGTDCGNVDVSLNYPALPVNWDFDHINQISPPTLEVYGWDSIVIDGDLYQGQAGNWLRAQVVSGGYLGTNALDLINPLEFAESNLGGACDEFTPCDTEIQQIANNGLSVQTLNYRIDGNFDFNGGESLEVSVMDNNDIWQLVATYVHDPSGGFAWDRETIDLTSFGWYTGLVKGVRFMGITTQNDVINFILIDDVCFGDVAGTCVYNVDLVPPCPSGAPFCTSSTNPQPINLNADQSENVIFNVEENGAINDRKEAFGYARTTDDSSEYESTHWDFVITSAPSDSPPTVSFVPPTPADSSSVPDPFFDVRIDSSDDGTGEHYVLHDFGWDSGRDLRQWLRFESLGATVLDESTYSNNDGTNNGATTATGKYGNAASFDGVADYIIADEDGVGNDFGSTLCNDRGCSFCAWVDPVDTSTTKPVISRWGFTGSDVFFWLIVNSDETVGFYIDSDGVFGGHEFAQTASGLTAGWHHICGVYDGSSITAGNVYVYVDGVLSATSAGTTQINPTAWLDVEDVLVGADNFDFPDSFFNGEIDDVAVLSRALTLDEIQSLYDAQVNQPYGPETFSGLMNGNSYTFTAHAVDLAGQRNSGLEERTVTIQGANTPPIVDIYSINIDLATGDTIFPFWVSLSNPIVKVNVVDNEDSITDITCKFSFTVSDYDSMTQTCTRFGSEFWCFNLDMGESAQTADPVTNPPSIDKNVNVACRDSGIGDNTGLDSRTGVTDVTPPDKFGFSPGPPELLTSDPQDIDLNTNENADCMWSLSDVPYGDPLMAACTVLLSGDPDGDGDGIDHRCTITGHTPPSVTISFACKDDTRVEPNEDDATSNVDLTYNVVLDSTPPSVVNFETYNTDDEVDKDFFVNQIVRIRADVTDSESGVGSVEAEITQPTGAVVTVVMSPEPGWGANTYMGEYTIPAGPLFSGVHLINLRAIDNAGNENADEFLDIEAYVQISNCNEPTGFVITNDYARYKFNDALQVNDDQTCIIVDADHVQVWAGRAIDGSITGATGGGTAIRISSDSYNATLFDFLVNDLDDAIVIDPSNPGEGSHNIFAPDIGQVIGVNNDAIRVTSSDNTKIDMRVRPFSPTPILTSSGRYDLNSEGTSTGTNIIFDDTIPIGRFNFANDAVTFNDTISVSGLHAGEIKFSSGITGSGNDLDSIVQFDVNYANVDSVSQAGFDRPADVVLHNAGEFITPVALRDGTDCVGCTLTPLTGNDYGISIPGFSYYSIGEGDDNIFGNVIIKDVYDDDLSSGTFSINIDNPVVGVSTSEIANCRATSDLGSEPDYASMSIICDPKPPQALILHDCDFTGNEINPGTGISISVACVDEGGNELLDTVTGEIDLTAPDFVPGSVTPIPDSTVQGSFTIDFTLDEVGDCRFSIGSDLGYDGMGSSCTDQGGNLHQCIISGLPDGPVTVYIGCADDTSFYSNKDEAGQSQAINYIVVNDIMAPLVAITQVEGTGIDSVTPFSVNVDTPTVTVTTDENANCYVDYGNDVDYTTMSGSPTAVACTPDGLGTTHICVFVSAIPDAYLPQGHKLSASCSDGFGNENTAGNNADEILEIDTVYPGINTPVTPLPPGPVVGDFNLDFTTDEVADCYWSDDDYGYDTMIINPTFGTPCDVLDPVIPDPDGDPREEGTSHRCVITGVSPPGPKDVYVSCADDTQFENNQNVGNDLFSYIVQEVVSYIVSVDLNDGIFFESPATPGSLDIPAVENTAGSPGTTMSIQRGSSSNTDLSICLRGSGPLANANSDEIQIDNGDGNGETFSYSLNVNDINNPSGPFGSQLLSLVFQPASLTMTGTDTSYYRFWLDIPSSAQPPGIYNNNIEFEIIPSYQTC